MGAGCHAMFSLAGATMLFSKDIERTNDDFVDERRSWSPAAVVDEYRVWSSRVITLATVVSRTPLARIPLPLAELGRFNAALILGGAMVFDHHTHLRHDIMPAVGMADPGSDANRMTVVIEWMVAVLRNPLKSTTPWFDQPIALTLHGAGGGSWTFTPEELSRSAVDNTNRIEADVDEFPEWGTRRCDWRGRDVKIHGDESLCTTFLDELNVV